MKKLVFIYLISLIIFNPLYCWKDPYRDPTVAPSRAVVDEFNNIYLGYGTNNTNGIWGLGFRYDMVGLGAFFFDSHSSGFGIDFNYYIQANPSLAFLILIGYQGINSSIYVEKETIKSSFKSFYFGYGFQFNVSNKIMLGITARTADDAIKFNGNWFQFNIGMRL
jgi:hypothetical protein